jgi:hypothetical protein
MDLPDLGSSGYLPELLHYLEAQPNLGGFFSVILLATIVRKGGIVIDVQREKHPEHRLKGKGKEDIMRDAVNKVVEHIFAVCYLLLSIGLD